MDLEIVPYVGAGLLRFGMTPDQIHQAMGAPTRSVKQAENRLREVYPFEAALVFEGPSGSLRLVEMIFNQRCNDLSYGGVRLFDGFPRHALRRVLQDDPSAGECLGAIIFPALGISATGFHDGILDDLAVTVWERGRMDAFKPRMKPFRWR